jgi:sirohydrochlorin ferrochelatase
MTVALIDNGSLEPAAHRQLRDCARDLGARMGVAVAAVSWKHSDRIAAAHLHPPAWTLEPWFRRRYADGEREFVFVPYFVSPQGAIGSALRSDLARLTEELGPAQIRFTTGLAEAGVLPRIVAHRVRECLIEHRLVRPAVVVVDHGGPSRASVQLRDAIAAAVAADLGAEAAPVGAASMEAPDGPEGAVSLPRFRDQLAARGFAGRPVVAAPLFLAPGRHAGPSGDLRQIAQAAEQESAGLSVHFTGLVGTHPLAAETLARGLECCLASSSS